MTNLTIAKGKIIKDFVLNENDATPVVPPQPPYEDPFLPQLVSYIKQAQAEDVNPHTIYLNDYLAEYKMRTGKDYKAS